MESIEESNDVPSWTSCWSKIQCPELKERACHSAAIIGDFLIGFGGWDAVEYFNDIVALNLVDMTWQKARITGDKPKGRYTHSTNLFKDDKIVVVGGYSGKTGVMRETAVMSLTGLEPLSFEWKTIQTEGDEDLYRSDHTANINGNFLYLFGGANKQEEGTNELWRLDLDTFTWKMLQTTGHKPRQRYGHCSVIYNDTLYVFGGYTTSLRTELNDFWRINLNDLIWQQIEHTPTTPTQRCAATALEVDGQIILFGGVTVTKGYSNYLFSYDIKTQHWERLKPLGKEPGGRGYHAAVYYKNKMIIWGGEKSQASCLNDLYSVELEDEALQPKKIEPKVIKQNTALSTLNKMAIDGLFTDVVFEVDGQNISAHKMVLAGGCKYFYDLFTSAPNDSKSNKIKIIDYNAQTFLALLKFLYCEDIELDYSLAINLLGFAHRYSLQSLKQVCDNYLAKMITRNNIEELNKRAEEFKALALKKAVLDFM